MSTATALPTSFETARALAPVALRLRAARRAALLTWNEVAAVAGVRAGAIEDFETGRIVLSRSVIQRLAAALHIGEEELYPGGRPDSFWRNAVRFEDWPMAVRAAGLALAA